MISSRISRMSSYAIRDIVVPALKLEKQGHKILKLNIGDPNVYDFDTPKFLQKALITAIKTKKNFYAESEGVPEVRESIAARENRLKGLNIKAENVLPTIGASEAINFIFGSHIDNGDEVLLSGPTYPLYISITTLYNGKVVEYKTSEENGWQPDIADIQEKITPRTKAIVVISPNNPTGAVYSKETLKAIADIAAEKNILVVSDEIYDMLTFENNFTSIATLNENGKYAILGGLSKVYLAPGWRIGYVAFKGSGLEELKESCYKLARARLCPNTPAQYAMKAAMDAPLDFVKKTIRKLKKRTLYCAKRINKIEGLSIVKPEAAFYLFPKIEKPELQDDKKFVLDLLHKKHVLCVHGSGFGAQYGKGHFRIVALADMETLKTAMDRIEEFMSEN